MAIGNNNFLNNKFSFKEKIDKHKVWLILAIAVAAVIILSLFLYSPIKSALFGKAFGTEICDNGIDDDADGAIDCWDWDGCNGQTGPGGVTCCISVSDCSSGEFCLESICGKAETPNELTCDDGFNNDADEFTDCADSDCTSDSYCVSSAITEICYDGLDNDKDGLIDCLDDSDCAGKVADSYGGTICKNGLKAEFICNDAGNDDDADGLVNCADSDCIGFPSSSGEYCCIVDSDCESNVVGVNYKCISNLCKVSTTTALGDFDSDNDGCVSLTELISYIGKWKTNTVTLTNLMTAISYWKSPAVGCS